MLISPSFQPRGTTVSAGLLFRTFHVNGTPNTWPFVTDFFHSACVQVSFMLYHVSVLHSSVWPSDIPLCGFIFFFTYFIYLCFICSSAGGHSGRFHLFGCSKPAVSTHMQALCGHSFSVLLGVIPGSGIAGSCGNSVSNLSNR